MIILGIDPGSSRIGFGAISLERRLPGLITYGTIDILPKDEHQKLMEAVSRFSALLKEVSPDLMAIEKIYFSKNRKTAIAVAQTRGALIAETQKNNIPVVEYDPSTVKKSVTGYGAADKKAVIKMVGIILKQNLTGFDDASDALAIALTAAYHLPRQ